MDPGDIVLDGHLAPPQKEGTVPLQFWPRYCMYCGQMAAWIKMPIGTGKASAQTTLC